MRVGGTTTCALVSKLTTVMLSPSRMRSSAATAAFMAFAMRSPFIEPERSITTARFIGEGVLPEPLVAAVFSSAVICAKRNVSPFAVFAREV